MDWIDIGYRVVTPMFIGGARPTAQNGEAATMRVPSLRGPLRYWFRALAGPSLGNRLEFLHAAEAAVFGSGDAPSRVWLRTRETFRAADGKVDWIAGRGIPYLLGQGLHHFENGLQRTFIPPGTNGELRVAIVPRTGGATVAAIGTLLGCTLWTLALYGGLGARARRGFGTIAFPHLNRLCELPPVAHADHDAVRQRFGAALAELGELPDVPAPGGQPRFPSFSHATPHLGPTVFNRWSEALNHAGLALRGNGQPAGRGSVDRGADSPANKRYVTPEYHAVIRILAYEPTAPPNHQFPLAGFGLPIQFKKDFGVTLFDGDGGELRRASPLWIRPVQVQGGWRLLCHLFESEFQPPGSEVRFVKDDQTPISLDATGAHGRVKAWLDAVEL